MAAELHDLVKDDMRSLYPDLIQHVAIRVIELQVCLRNAVWAAAAWCSHADALALQDHVLSTYDRAISNYCAELFSRWVLRSAGPSKRLQCAPAQHHGGAKGPEPQCCCASLPRASRGGS